MGDDDVIAALAEFDDDAAALELSRLRGGHPDLVVQMVSMQRVPNARALRMVAEQTMRALETGALLASKPEVDLLLRLAGTTQIAEAVERIGYRQQKGKGRKKEKRLQLVVVAAGRSASVQHLAEELAAHQQYSILIEAPLSDEQDSEIVEVAALLGTRA